jgi:hypothetical protein
VVTEGTFGDSVAGNIYFDRGFWRGVGWVRVDLTEGTFDDTVVRGPCFGRGFLHGERWANAMIVEVRRVFHQVCWLAIGNSL